MDINRKIFAAQQDTPKKDKLLLIPRHIFVEHGLSNSVVTLLNQLFPSTQKGYIICDDNSYLALAQQLATLTSLPVLQLPCPTKATIDNVELIQSTTTEADYLIAVGSGTINDLCKYASFCANKPYVVFGTAASMNGYLSANASITSRSGTKSTLAAHLPHAAFLDLDIICAAPARLNLAGYGDSICRSTAQFDWLHSHLLLGTAYDASLFDMLLESEMELIKHADTLHSGSSIAVKALIENLLLSGVSMFLAGGSYPASQGEHLLAHYIDTHCDSHIESYHGEHIAVTTPIMARIQQQLLAQDTLHYTANTPNRNNFLTHLPPHMRDEYYQQYRTKIADADTHIYINRQLNLHWQDIRQQLQLIAMNDQQIVQQLKLAGCPIEAEHIGWQQPWLTDAVHHAHFTRDRFTSLDLINGTMPTASAFL